MDLKRILGAMHLVMGIAGLVYASVLFTNASSVSNNIRAAVIYSILGLFFLISGIGLVRRTKEELNEQTM